MKTWIRKDVFSGLGKYLVPVISFIKNNIAKVCNVCLLKFV